MINRLTREHLTDIVDQVLEIANRAIPAHEETARDVTTTIKIKLKFDKDAVRSEWRAVGAVDMPDGELDSEIKRTDSVFLCTLHSDSPGQAVMESVQALRTTLRENGATLTVVAGGKTVEVK